MKRERVEGGNRVEFKILSFIKKYDTSQAPKKEN
jgi:hypothetical protein